MLAMRIRGGESYHRTVCRRHEIADLDCTHLSATGRGGMNLNNSGVTDSRGVVEKRILPRYSVHDIYEIWSLWSIEEAMDWGRPLSGAHDR